MNDSDLAEAYRLLGTLTRERFDHTDHDGWTCVSHDTGTPGRRDAFIGNGLIGLRVPVEGQPSLYPLFHAVKMAPGGTQMYNLWDIDEMMPALNFLGLEVRHGRSVFRRDSGALLRYTQTLDWKTATVTTECDWVHWGGTLHIKIRIWLDRVCKNLGCVEMELIPAQADYYTIVDKVDGGFLPIQGETEYFLRRPGDTAKCVFLRAGGRRRLQAAATMISLDGEDQAGNLVPMRGGFERQIPLHSESGRRYLFRKCAALFADGQCDDPQNAAATLAAGGMAHFEEHRAAHEAAWACLWEHDIEVPHPGVQMLARTALYQLYANVGEGVDAMPGPTGLTGNAWKGHLFHDGEAWTFPPLLLLHPELARNYVNYRYRTLPGARRNAAAYGMAGAQYAWESAEFGDESIPGLVYMNQHQINSCVALAQWQFYLVSGDRGFLERQGAEILFANADFWVSRATYNAERDRYEIRQVCCPDEWACLQDNNAMTNYSAKATLEIAARVAGMLGRPADPRWLAVAEKLWVPIDEGGKHILEYEGYAGQPIKQADATLVIYPLEMPLPEEIRRGTVEYYRVRYGDQKIMMGSAIDGVIDCEVGNPESSWEAFLDLLQHFRGDFLLASESPFNETISLLTGMCGMLQLIIMGWGGVRIHEDGLAAASHLPKAIPWMKLKGLHYGGECFDLEYRDGKVLRHPW